MNQLAKMLAHANFTSLYHLVTVASKFLTLQESVCNDVSTSIFVCDTHVDLSDTWIAGTKPLLIKSWRSNSGCFEVPSMKKMPKEVFGKPLDFKTNLDL